MLKARYPEIKRMIETRMDAGEWPDKLPGVAALGKELGVNQLTVSKAVRLLADEGKVTILGRRGTFATRSDRGVKHGTIGVVGMLPSEMAREDEGCEMAAIQDATTSSGYAVYSIGHASIDADKALKGIMKMPIDGLIFNYSSLTPELISKLRVAGKAFVSMNRISETPGVSWVDYDGESGYRKALRHLLCRRHRRIAMIGYRFAVAEHEQRIRDLYRRELESAGVYDESLYHVDETHRRIRQEYGDQADRAYAQRVVKWLSEHPHPPTACLVTRGRLAKALLEELAGSNVPPLSVFAICPETISLEGPDLEGVLVQKVSRRARAAGEALIELLENPKSAPIQKLIDLEFKPCIS